MKFDWLIRKKVIRVRRRSRRTQTRSSTKHYEAHKERARILVHERLAYWNQFYGLIYKRVAIRNQRSRWGSCSTKGNLNFNYRLVFLSVELVDYVVVHELCHLKHFNHSETFWSAVGEQIPDYQKHKEELHYISKNVNAYMTEGVGPLQSLSDTQNLAVAKGTFNEQIKSISDTVPAL